ncbi:MAG: TauD/TfdA family dioxygenase [Chloroflexota bacterium]
MSKLNVSPVTEVIGAMVEGVDLNNLSDDAFTQIVAALDQHLVIYLPDQALDRFQLSRLGQRFGPPFLHPIVDNGFDDCPDVLELRREPNDETVFGGASWHADVSWLKPGGYVSILHGKIVPSVGGDTSFVSSIAAFNSLSPGMQELLRGLNVIHSYYGPGAEIDERYMAIYPVVRKHPNSGAEGLFVNRMFVTGFEGMTETESKPLLDYLYTLLEEHRFSCRFRWQPGAVLMWDNRFTLHYPINDNRRERRVMIRTTSLED